MAYTTIDNPEAYFQTILYTGASGTNPRSHTLPADTDMQPDFIWLKQRNATQFHVLTDSARGAGKMVISNNDDGEATNSNSGYISAFNSDGFTTTNGTSNELYVNTTGSTYVGWCWKAGTTSGITTNGSTDITPSAYSFNQTSGFSIVDYNGNETAGAELAHGLGAVPHFMMFKRTDGSASWIVYHHKNTSAPETDNLVLSSTAATEDSETRWNDTAPDSVNVALGSTTYINKNGSPHVGYIFSEKQGYSKFGSYTATQNSNGPYIHLGFRAAWIMVKRTSTSGKGWIIFDNKRLGYNVDNEQIEANSDGAEYANHYIDICANGFKFRDDNQDVNNPSGGTYIYAAFAEAPFVNSNGVPCNAR